MTTPRNRTRSGRFDQEPETAKLDAEAARLRGRGLEYGQIAQVQGCTKGTAFKRVQRALRAVPVEAVTELRRIEMDRLDSIIARAWEVVDAAHPMVSAGRLIDGVSDAGPVLAALNLIRTTSESKRKLLGLDAPARQTVTVVTEDVVDAELRRLEQEIAAMDAQA